MNVLELFKWISIGPLLISPKLPTKGSIPKSTGIGLGGVQLKKHSIGAYLLYLGGQKGVRISAPYINNTAIYRDN